MTSDNDSDEIPDLQEQEREESRSNDDNDNVHSQSQSTGVQPGVATRTRQLKLEQERCDQYHAEFGAVSRARCQEKESGHGELLDRVVDFEENEIFQKMDKGGTALSALTKQKINILCSFEREADCLTSCPLQGKMFQYFRDIIRENG